MKREDKYGEAKLCLASYNEINQYLEKLDLGLLDIKGSMRVFDNRPSIHFHIKENAVTGKVSIEFSYVSSILSCSKRYIGLPYDVFIKRNMIYKVSERPKDFYLYFIAYYFKENINSEFNKEKLCSCDKSFKSDYVGSISYLKEFVEEDYLNKSFVTSAYTKNSKYKDWLASDKKRDSINLDFDPSSIKINVDLESSLVK